jgi:sulfotransferase family protein
MRLPSRLRRGRGDRRRRGSGRAPAPFIVGVSRSGTTSLRVALDAHPQLAIPPETHFVPELVETCQAGGARPAQVVTLLAGEPHWPLFGVDAGAVAERLPAAGPVKPRAALRAFYGAYAAARGKPRWGDETPGYLHVMRLIAGALPEARFVHLVRDVRDVALSMVAAGQIRPDAVDGAARQWARQVAKARLDAARVGRCLEVRYEDLAHEPRGELGRVAEFLELPWDAALLDALPTAGRPTADAAGPTPPGTRPPVVEPPGRWRTDMSPEDRAACESAAGELLVDLGYEIGDSAALDGILQGGGPNAGRDG